MKKGFFIILLFFNIFIFSFSEVVLIGQSNYTSMYEPIQIAIEFRNTNKDRYEIQGIQNFRVTGRTTQRSYYVENHRKYAMLVDIYQLMPVREGIFRLRIRTNREYSNTIEIAVGRRSNNNYSNQRQGYPVPAPRPQQQQQQYSGNSQQQYGSYMGSREDFKIAESLEKNSIYLGEKIIYSEYFRAYALLRSFEYKDRPKFENISSTDYTPIDSGKNLKKREYTQNGKKVIELTLYRGVVQGNLSGEQIFYTGSGEVIADSTFLIPSRKIKLNVKPLPEEGKPQDFQGVVGAPNIQYKWDDKNQEVGKTLTLSLKVSGGVNLDNLDKINYPSSENFDVYSTLKSSKDEIRDGKHYAEKWYEVAFIPKKSGQLNIPQYAINYFNPKTEKYESFTIEGKNLNIAESTDGSVSSGVVQNPAVQPEPPKEELAAEENKAPENTQNIAIVKETPNKSKLNYWFVILGVAALIQGIILLKMYLKNKKFTILKSEENPLNELRKAKTDMEFYDAYANYMVKKYKFNPKLHSEIRLEDTNLKEVNRALEEWKFKGTPFSREELLKKLEDSSKEV